MGKKTIHTPAADDQELAFIQACLAVELFPGRLATAAPANLDWDRVYHLLDRHRLAPHFFVLGSTHPGLLPQPILERLRPDRYQLVLYGDQCQARVHSVLSALVEAGIPVIVLKGWAHIQTIYGGDPGQRFCEDIDLLVKSCDVDRAESRLRQIGYQLEDESWAGYTHRYVNANRFFYKKEPGFSNALFSVGLHWGLFHIPYYDASLVNNDALFERAQRLRVGSLDVLELGIDDQIVYNCSHLGLHHRYDPSLFRYYELAAIILKSGNTVDWDAVVERAREWNTIISVRRVLASLNELWPGTIPPQVLERLGDMKTTVLERFTDLWIEKTKGNGVLASMLPYLTMPGLKRFWMMFQDAFPNPAYMHRRYGPAPGGFIPLLYLRRFTRAFHFLRRKSTSNS